MFRCFVTLACLAICLTAVAGGNGKRKPGGYYAAVINDDGQGHREVFKVYMPPFDFGNEEHVRGPAIDAKRLMPLAVEIAREYIPESRASNPYQITKFLNLRGLDFRYDDGTPVPYCASGVAYAVTKAYCVLSHVPFTARGTVKVFKDYQPRIWFSYFKPSASCQEIVDDARSRNMWTGRNVPKSAIKKGWLVFYNFGKGNHAYHIGLVDKVVGNTLYAVEFNTSLNKEHKKGVQAQVNGGAIEQKLRLDGSILGYAMVYEPYPARR